MPNSIDSQIYKTTVSLSRRFTNMKPFLPFIAALIRSKIVRNFSQGGCWNGSGTGLFDGGSQRWAPLAPSTVAAYRKKGWTTKPTLNRHEAGLRSSVYVEPSGSNSIVIGSGLPYAAIHQYGGNIPVKSRSGNSGGRVRKVSERSSKKTMISIPARPYITLSPQDLSDIVEKLSKEMMKAKY